MSLKEELAQDIRKLVKQLTGFDEEDDNLRRCENYAVSNILHHRYVSVDGQNVRKAIEGIITKFFVHGHLEASKKLSELIEKFVTNERFNDPSRRDEQWAVLLLFLNLANSPTNNVPVEELAEPIKEKSKDDENFNWGEYLMDGVDPFIRPYNDDSDDSFGSSDWDDSGVDGVGEENTPSIPSVEGLKSVVLEQTNKNEVAELINKGVEAEEWLKENIQNCWWITGDLPNEVHSKYPCANLAKLWEDHSVPEGTNDCCRQKTVKISEYKVVREILFMLHSPTTTYLFKEKNGHFVARDDVTIPSLTKDSVKSYLEDLCRYINIVHQLRKFWEDVYGDYKADNSTTKKLPTFTFEVYAASLHEFLMEFGQFVAVIENRVRKQEDINTLYQIICELRPKLKELKVVYDTHIIATQGWKDSPSWLAVTRLLSVLYRAGVCAAEGYESTHILKLFLKSFRPYFDIICTWLTEGQLEDWRQEFIISRNDRVIEGTWERWEQGFTLHPYKNTLLMFGIEPLPLLEDVAQKVLHAGKSIELLKKLSGDFSHLCDAKGSLYKEFLSDIMKQIPGEDEQQVCGDGEQPDVPVTVDASAPPFKLNLLAERPSLDYPALGKIVKNIFGSGDTQFQWQDTVLTAEQEILDTLVHKLSSRCFPIKPVMESIFTNLIEEKHGTACSLVKNMLHTEFNIALQLSVVRNIFLMEGNDMEKFCSYVFREVERNYDWDNAYSLTSELENCVDERYPLFTSKFSVSVSQRSQTVVSVDTLDSIKISYSVEWPMNLIFSKTNMKIYNSVFKFLLKVKWALWALQQLRFNRGEKEENTKAESARNIKKRNLLWLLRFWMLHSIGCIQSYLMGQVLVSLGLELERAVEEAADLDALIKVHSSYVQKVYTHCLQPEVYEPIRGAILQLVTLALKLREIWLVGLEIVSEKILGKMGDSYIQCHWKLGGVLQTAVDDSHDLHLTHLSDAINSTPPQKELLDS